MRGGRRQKRGPLGSWVRGNADVLGPTALAAVVLGLVIATSGILPLIGDAVGYSMTALRLVQEGFLAYSTSPPGTSLEPSAFITPGYVLFLSAIYIFQRASGEAPATVIAAVHPTVVVVQYGMSLAIVGLTALSGRALGGRRLGWTTGVLASLYLPFGWAAAVALSEQLGALLMISALAFALHLSNRRATRSWPLFAGFGALNGCLALVRPVSALWFLVPLCYIASRRFEQPRRLVQLVAATLLGLALVLGPWVARNAVVLHRFVPLSTTSGVVLFDGTGGGEFTAAERDTYNADRARGVDDSGARGRIGMDRIRADLARSPAEFLWARLTRAGLVVTGLWSPVHDVLWELNTRPEDNPSVIRVSSFDAAQVDRSRLFYEWMKLYRWLILAGAGASLLFIRRSPRLIIVASMPAYAIGIHFFTLFNNRYFYPSTPALIVLAGTGVMGIALTVRRWIRASGTADAVLLRHADRT